jgi:hypothetical protein
VARVALILEALWRQQIGRDLTVAGRTRWGVGISVSEQCEVLTGLELGERTGVASAARARQVSTVDRIVETVPMHDSLVSGEGFDRIRIAAVAPFAADVVAAVRR